MIGPKSTSQIPQEKDLVSHKTNNLEQEKFCNMSGDDNNNPEPWEHSKAKQVLYKDIVNGVVCKQDKPKDVYQMHNGLYKPYKYERFHTNLRNLENLVNLLKEHANEDEKAFENDFKVISNLCTSAKTHNGTGQKRRSF